MSNRKRISSVGRKFQEEDIIVLRRGEHQAEYGAIAVVTGYEEVVYAKSTEVYVDVHWTQANGLAHNQQDGGYMEKDFDLRFRQKEMPLEYAIEQAIRTIKEV